MAGCLMFLSGCLLPHTSLGVPLSCCYYGLEVIRTGDQIGGGSAAESDGFWCGVGGAGLLSAPLHQGCIP